MGPPGVGKSRIAPEPALLTRARGDDIAYWDYRAMAVSLGFDGHIAWADAMP